MPAPSSDSIVADPPPLNATVFPFAVDEFPAPWLAQFAGLIPLAAHGEAVARAENPQRYQQ